MIMDREIFQPIQTTAVMIHLIRENYPHQFEWREGHLDRLWGSDDFRNYIESARNIRAHRSTYAEDRDTFYEERRNYLIYKD